MKILVDTNVFLDLLLGRPPFYDEDLRLFNNIKNKNHQIYINAMQFRDIEYALRKKIEDKNKLYIALNSIYQLVTKVIPLTADDAINSIFDYKKDFEDYMLACSCESAMLDCVVTNNKKDFKHETVKVFSVEEFNKIIESSL